MKRIVIFRFHVLADICLNRLELIAKLNPGTPIFGIYGGSDEDLPEIKKQLAPLLSSLFVIKGRTSEWKWQNFDLALRDWYTETGHAIDFDIAHIIEWDLILAQPLHKMYAHIGTNELALTSLTKLSDVGPTWMWTNQEPYKTEWEKLLLHAQNTYRYAQEPFASLGPGLSVPRLFLEKYTEADVPELAHDELRVPLFAQIFDLTCKDSGLREGWDSDEEDRFFNCDGVDIPREIIIAEIDKKDGRRAFHPFKDIIGLELVAP